MRSALIVGAGGQDGQLLGRLLLERGYEVRGWTRTAASPSLPFACEPIDVIDQSAVRKQLDRLQPDEIYYLAAFHCSSEDHTQLSSGELLRRSFDVHVSGLLNVLRSGKSSRLFYAASSHAFGAPAGEFQDEQTPLLPHSAYGISKAAGIQCCRLLREQEGAFASTGILFNHESSLRKHSFLSQKIVQGALRARRDPGYQLVLGDLEARVDWGYAPDYVEAMWRILQLPSPGDFVVASGELHSVREFAQTAFGTLGLDWRRHVQADPSLLARTTHASRGNAQKLRAATGWSPTVSFTEMVAKLVHDAELAA